MTKPIIGITMAFDDKGMVRPGIQYNIIRREYGEQVKAAGGEPIFIDPSIDPVTATHLCDGIVITGGDDIDPMLYATKEHENAGPFESSVRVNWERELIDACDWAGKAILGICYGSQLLNVHYGGTLYQDLAGEQDGSFDHGLSSGGITHEVVFSNDFFGLRCG